VLFSSVVETSAAVARTSKRSEKSELLADLLRGLAEPEIEPVVGFLVGEVCQGRIGVGWAAVSGIDVGAAGQPSLTVLDVDSAISEIAGKSGTGSQEVRRRLLATLLGLATAAEGEFLRRLFIGEIRQGANRGVMTDALAKAAGLKAAVVRRAVMLAGDLGRTAVVALTLGDEAVRAIGLRVMNPIQPMLASTAPDVGAAMETVAGEASVEWKLDGIRIQVHRLGNEVRIYTRNLNDVTARLDEVCEMARGYGADSFVLDGEVVGNHARFQDVASSFGTEVVDGERGLYPRYFDIVHINGRDLVDEPLRVRRAELRALVGDHLIPGRLTHGDAVAAEVLAEALDSGHEGVMVKAADSTYEAGRRGKSWLKVKPVITLDLIVIGAEWGHGRRTGSLSNLHLGARDPDSGDAVMVGKTFKGLTDELLAWQTKEFLAREVGRDGHTVFVEQNIVVEIAVDGVQSSTRYPGGVALRFARVRGYRDDKITADADTIDAVRALLR